jgi:anti-sigma factor RsiW
MSSNCDQVHAYHDGELTGEQRAAFESHLSGCRGCQQLLSELKALSSLFGQASLAELPPRAMGRMYGSFHAAAAQRERGVRRLAGWMTAAAAAVLALAFVRNPTLLRPADEQPTPAAGWSELVAVMPPLEPGEGSNAELVRFAQWTAGDLSAGETR